MKYQLAKLYRGDRFLGYGIAVGGLLLEGQVSTKIETATNELPIVNAIFNLSNEHPENQPRIDLNNPNASNEFQIAIHTDKPLTLPQINELRDTVNDFLTRHNLSKGGGWTS